MLFHELLIIFRFVMFLLNTYFWDNSMYKILSHYTKMTIIYSFINILSTNKQNNQKYLPFPFVLWISYTNEQLLFKYVIIHAFLHLRFVTYCFFTHNDMLLKNLSHTALVAGIHNTQFTISLKTTDFTICYFCFHFHFHSQIIRIEEKINVIKWNLHNCYDMCWDEFWILDYLNNTYCIPLLTSYL